MAEDFTDFDKGSASTNQRDRQGVPQDVGTDIRNGWLQPGGPERIFQNQIEDLSIGEGPLRRTIGHKDRTRIGD